MCEICMKSPHDPRCPNAKEPEEIPVFVCSGCGTDIMDGEDYWTFLNEQFCEHCVDKARQTARAVE